MKERWKEMLEYQQKVQAMNDLERAREVVSDFCDTRRANLSDRSACNLLQIVERALATARQEGAEAGLAALNEALSNGDPEIWRKVDVGIPKAVAAAERRGAEEMRERAAQEAESFSGNFVKTGDYIADAIRALPLEAKE